MKIKPRMIEKVTIINVRRIGAYSQFSLLDPMPPEGPIIIGTALKQMGYDVMVIDESITPLYPESSLWQIIADSDMVGVSAMTHTENRAYQILQKTKSINPLCLCIAGGFGPSSNPKKALKRGADRVVIGEGVETIKELMLAYRDGGNTEDIQGIAWQEQCQTHYSLPRPLMQNLDNVPFADWSLLIKGEKAKIRTITLSAGCPFDCSFCAVTKFYGRKYRHRSVNNAIEYLQWAYQGHKSLLWTREKTIFIGDDNFAANPEWTKELLQEIIKLNLPKISFSVQMRAQSCRDQELMDLIEEAPLARIFFGYEDITSDGLKSINKKQSIEDILISVEECRKRKISINASFMLGLDSHTCSSGIEMADFALKHGIDVFILFIKSPFPGTSDTEKLTRGGRLLNIPTDYRDAQFVVFQPLNLTAKELQESQIQAIKHFYQPSQALQDWRKGRINKYHVLYRLAGHHYVLQQEKHARAFVQKYLSQ